MNKRRTAAIFALVALAACGRGPVEYHVSPAGDDSASGAAGRPLKTISAAARRAQPGDTVTVHGGVYRERIDPPRGGVSEEQRIVYRAAPGERVEIKGSEIVKGWEDVGNGTWKVVLPDSFFGDFNPFADEIKGDWFKDKGRKHHTGAVYLNGHWLTEAASLSELSSKAAGSSGKRSVAGSLFNVAWFRVGAVEESGERMPADGFVSQQGLKTAECSEGGQCIGWVEPGDWAVYGNTGFGKSADRIRLRVASATNGGVIEFRKGKPEGELLGSCAVGGTGGWQSWVDVDATFKPLPAGKALCLVFRRTGQSTVDLGPLWFAEVGRGNTTIHAQFPGGDPNRETVEVNMRRTVFYPSRPGINYLTVRGFVMRHAATPWAPPTAEQVGLIGTHWSRGWIIEDNDIAYSVCSGIALGKYGDEFDNKSQSADAYNQTIRRALANGWNKATVGSHIVRNNTVSHCEQAGIVGSMGCAFSEVSGNEIHDIHVRKLFTGAEMAGIKFHGAIDTLIARNHVYRTHRGLWLDWMAQGARVSGNLFHDNDAEDLFFEVNHGPLLVDNNIFLSSVALKDMSEGGAYAHNLFAGKITTKPELKRATPYHMPHSTEVAGLHNIEGGDNRYYNNLFMGGAGLADCGDDAHPPVMEGNVFLNGAVPCAGETGALHLPAVDPRLELVEKDGVAILRFTSDGAWLAGARPFVTTALLGKPLLANVPFENPDGTPLAVDRDYLGHPRNRDNPAPGPFEALPDGAAAIQVWPGSSRQTLCLNGGWQVAQSVDPVPPATYEAVVPVPGLVDMAQPAFKDPGAKNPERNWFWYRKTFDAPARLPEFATLKLHKAAYGTAVWVNGKPLGEQYACFTPTYWELRQHLKAGAANEIVVRIGATREAVPPGIPAGWDFEKVSYIPGIYDSVEVQLCDGPRIANVQCVPDIVFKRVRLLVEVEAGGKAAPGRVEVEIVEAKGGKSVANGTVQAAELAPCGKQMIDLTLPVADCKLWWPEDPFLYEVRIKTAGDVYSTRFGMREFRFDPQTKRAVLNGQQRYLRGSNVCIYRFFEDPARGAKPWDREWVRKLHRQFKTMNWDTLRYCIGFPPEFWYDIADEEGILIQDEYPVWTLNKGPEILEPAKMIPHYRDWMRERWNHPCVVIWDAQNESAIEESGLVLSAVRHLDYSNRPWENGWGVPQGPFDCTESHPYLFQRSHNKPDQPLFHFSEIPKTDPMPRLKPEQRKVDVPVIINEYDWLWINRDGTPCTLSKRIYDEQAGPDATAEQRRVFHARSVAALTEFWRAHRKAAGILHFCGLGYSRPGTGQTSDDFTDLDSLEFEPNFKKYVSMAFHPVGIMLDFWEEKVVPGASMETKVYVINDRQEPWSGEVRLRIDGDKDILARAKCEVAPLGQTIIPLKFKAPARPGKFTLAAELDDAGKAIRSLRDSEGTTAAGGTR